jgi:hypothetical protein
MIWADFYPMYAEQKWIPKETYHDTTWKVASPAAILLAITRTINHNVNRRIEMSRESGDWYHCNSCGAELVYEKPCPSGEGMVHSEICCSKQMSKIEGRTAGATRSTKADY